MTHQHRARGLTGAATLLGALLTGALAGCGSGSPQADVTVTVTPTVTATAKAKGTPAPRATSDVKGRAYDFGAVRKVSTIAGQTVIELDRYTWKGLADTKLAQQGVPKQWFKGDLPYENQNTRLTFSIPVADGASILQRHCVAADQPLQTKSVDAAALATLPDRENTVLVKLDDRGWLTSAQNIAGCPD